MAPKEKAKSLINKYTICINYDCIANGWHDPFNTERNRRVKKRCQKTITYLNR